MNIKETAKKFRRKFNIVHFNRISKQYFVPIMEAGFSSNEINKFYVTHSKHKYLLKDLFKKEDTLYIDMNLYKEYVKDAESIIAESIRIYKELNASTSMNKIAKEISKHTDSSERSWVTFLYQGIHKEIPKIQLMRNNSKFLYLVKWYYDLL